MVSLPYIPGLNSELQPFHEQTYRRSYPPEVERWRAQAEKYLRPQDADKLLHVIKYESGGNPKATNPESGAQGLLQMLPSHGFDGYDPDTAFKWAADQVASHGWTDWGEGVTYQGKPFGALGAHPYEGGGSSPGIGITVDPSFGQGIGISGDVPPTTPQRVSNEPGRLFDPGSDLQPVQSGDVPYDAGTLMPAGQEDTPLRAAGTLRERLRNTQLQQGLGSVPVTPHTENTDDPLALFDRVREATAIPYVTPALEKASGLVGDVARKVVEAQPGALAQRGLSIASQAAGGPELNNPSGDIAETLAAGLVPTHGLDVLMGGLSPLDDVAREGVAGARALNRGARAGGREAAVRAGASGTLDRILPPGLLADERRGANAVEGLVEKQLGSPAERAQRLEYLTKEHRPWLEAVARHADEGTFGGAGDAGAQEFARKAHDELAAVDAEIKRLEGASGARTQGARLGQQYGPDVAGGNALPPGGPVKPPVAPETPAAPRGAPLADVGDRGIQEALAAKQEATLQPGRVLGEEGSLQRKVVGALNPSIDMPPAVHVANQARTGVGSLLRTELSGAEVPAYRRLAQTFEAEAPRYIGPEGRPLANTWVDYAENPRFYDDSAALAKAREELRGVQDASLNRVRSDFGVDVGRFEASHDPDAVYVPHMQSRADVEKAAEATRQSISKRGSVAKERAYDSLSDRVARNPKWKPELDPAVLADTHAAALANMAANNTFHAGVAGKTLTEVIDETHPGLREARDKLAQRVQTVKAKIDLAEQRIGEADASLSPLIKEQMAIDERATPRFVAVSEADRLTPELSTMQTQLRELRIRARAIDKAVTRAQGKQASAGLRLNDALSELGSLEPRLTELRARYNTAAPGDYVRGPDFRYHEPKTAEAMDSVLKTGFGNAFIDGAIEAGNKARAAGLGPDFSPLTIQGALGAFSHPEVAITNGAGMVRAFRANGAEEFAKLLDPELAQRFEFASGRRIGSLGEDALGTGGVSLPGPLKGKVKGFNEALQRVVDYGTLKAFENDSALLMKLGQESQNIADHEAANSISKFIPRINNAETGRSVQRVKLEGLAPTSRSFTAQPFSLAKDFAAGLAKVVSARPGELLGREKLALIRGSSLMGSVLTLSVGSALLSAEANGKDPAEAVKEVIDPSSGRFLHLIIGSEGSIGLGGPFRSAFLGVFRTATQGPEGAYKYATGRLQPVLGAVEDVATNRDWKGDTVREGSDWHQLLQSVEHIAKSANLLSGGAISGLEEGGLSGAATQTVAGLGGVNYQERTAYDERDRAAREQFGKPYGELFPADKAKIDALGLAPQSDYKKRADEVHAPIVAEQKRAEDLFTQGNLDKRLPEYYHDLGQRKLQAGHDLETQFAKDFAGFDKDKYRSALDGYYATEKKDERGSQDFDATEAARQDYLDKLPEDQRRWISEALGVSREKQTPLRQEYLTYIDAKKKAGYFKDGLTARERTALDAAHVDLDLQSWFFNGGVKDKSGGQLNSKAAVDQALQMIEQRKLPNRAVYINGADRDMALPENRKFWEAEGSLIANFTGDAYSKKYGDQEAQKQYTRGNVKSPRYADLSPGEQAEVDAAIRRTVKNGSPELEAVMAYAGVGGNATDKVYAVSPEAAPFVSELRKKYGETAPKPGWEIVKRR